MKLDIYFGLPSGPSIGFVNIQAKKMLDNKDFSFICDHFPDLKNQKDDIEIPKEILKGKYYEVKNEFSRIEPEIKTGQNTEEYTSHFNDKIYQIEPYVERYRYFKRVDLLLSILETALTKKVNEAVTFFICDHYFLSNNHKAFLELIKKGKLFVSDFLKIESKNSPDQLSELVQIGLILIDNDTIFPSIKLKSLFY